MIYIITAPVSGCKKVRIEGINTWIKNNPQVTDPNVYEIMDCNVQYAELVAELVAYYNEFGWPEINEETGDMMLEKAWPRSARVSDLPHLQWKLYENFQFIHLFNKKNHTKCMQH